LNPRDLTFTLCELETGQDACRGVSSRLSLRHVKEGSITVNRTKTLRAQLPLASLSIALLAISLPASAHQRHTIKPGETLGSIARKYHVAVKEIVAWNGLKNADRLSEGMSILIPTASKSTTARTEKSPPRAEKRTIARSTMYRKAAIKGDRISVRVGPGTEHRRLNMFDNGAPMLVTAERNGWAQVQMPNGKTGWTMLTYLKFSGKTPAPTKWVTKATKPAPKTVKHLVKWTPPKAAAKKAVVKTAVPKWKQTAAKRANDRAWKATYAKQVAEARRAARQKREMAKIVRSAPRVAKRYTPEASAPEANTDIVRSAYSYRGTPYRYGGSARGGFDCSGFTSYLYRQKGVNLPHSARAQAQMGQKVDKANLKAGDLVFFHTVTPGISHVGMYVGDGKFVHASSRRSGGVRVDSLNSGYYSQRLRGARRYSK
jgi:cell wall-associated NlpC family hydrolase